MQRKGQISFYIMIGLIIFGLTGIFFYFQADANTSAITEEGVEEKLVNRLTNTQIVSLVEGCLEQSASDALYYAGLQAGHILKSQQGLSDVQRGVSYRISNESITVPFGIVAPSVKYLPPYYPREFGVDGYRYSIEDLKAQFGRHSLYGQVTLPKLCDLDGPNGPATYTCDPKTYGATQSTIQENIRVSALNGLQNCVAGQLPFIEDLAQDFSLENESLTVILADKSVRFILDSNTTISHEGSDFSFSRTTYDAPVRLKRMYNLLYHILREDSKNVSFDKSKDYADLTVCNYADRVQCWDSGMSVNVIRSPQENGHPGADIVVIEDLTSGLKRGSFVLQAAVVNRAPVLDYLRTQTSEQHIDYALERTDSIFFQPNYEDPDEDRVTISYDGWRQRAFEESLAYVLGENCADTSSCGVISFTKEVADVKEINIVATDSSGLFDSQPVKIRLGDLADDSVEFCPKKPDTHSFSTCDSSETRCVCPAGGFCFWNEAKPIECQAGSICCQDVTVESNSVIPMTCEGAECYQRSSSAPISASCSNGANCTQDSQLANAALSCSGSNCYQHTVNATGTVSCSGSFCHQTTDVGILETSCDDLAKFSNDQSGTEHICG